MEPLFNGVNSVPDRSFYHTQAFIMSKFGSFIVGLFTGVVAGTVFGVLYAPDEGKRTRNQLSFQLSKLKERLQELSDQMMKGKEVSFSEAKMEGEKNISHAKLEAERIEKEIEKINKELKKTDSNTKTTRKKTQK